MSILSGTYECKVDAKGRFTLPSALKKDLASVLECGFVLKRSLFENCLEFYPLEYWNKKLLLMNKKINLFDRKQANFLRKYTAGVRRVEVDAAGRILIPKELVAFASVSKDIVLTGTGSILEIWDKASYELVISAEDVGDLAQDIFGDNNIFDELS